MGEFLEIAKVMVQPTMKLLEMCGSAIGTAYEPRHVRKMADAEAYKIRQLGAAITESDNLPVSYENGDVSMSTVNFEDFAKRAEFRAKYQLLQEQKNRHFGGYAGYWYRCAGVSEPGILQEGYE